VDVGAVVDELYQQDPGSFTSQRDARVAAARREGDRPAAVAIKAFKRPSPPAWAINLLARAHPDEIDELVDLGARLRQAQASLSGEELRVLTRERRKFVVGLAREARSLASDHGHPLSATAARQVEDTLNAALADPEASVAVASGRLVRSLEHAGLGPVDLDGAVAGTVTASSTAGSRRRRGKAESGPTKPGPAPPGVTEPGPEPSARARVEAELKEMRAEAATAEEQLRSAQRGADEAASALKTAARRQADADSEVRRLEAQLDSARSQAEAAKVEAALASRSREDADRSLEAARLRAREVQKRLTAIERRHSSRTK
jgi:hypothetical protein